MEKMTPREIDALVAEKVMGWGESSDPTSVHEFYNKDTGEHTIELPQLPHYSTNIADAWQVVEKLTEYGDRSFSLDRCCYYHTDSGHEQPQKYIAYFGRGANSTDDSAPMAICLAALKACGVEV